MNRLKRLIVIMVSIIVCFLLQTIVIPLIPYLNTVPNLMLIVVLASGFLFGKAYGLLAGILCGLLLDVLGSGTLFFYTLVYMWLGFGNGMLSEKLESEMISVLFLLLAANELIFHIYQFCLAFLIRKSFTLLPYVTGVFIPEVLLTMICFLVIYGVLIFIAKRWDLKVNKGEVKIV